MRLTQYLTEFQNIEDQEGSRVKKIDEVAARNVIQSKCKKAISDYKKGRYIQRYARHAPSIPFGFLDSSKLPPRLSRNSFNYYTLIINGDSSWKGFPRRQIIGSLRIVNRQPIQNSGEFVIFPFDGVKVGICPTQDIWDSFSVLKTIGISANRMNDFIAKMLNLGNNNLDYGHDGSLPEFKKACKVVDKWIAGTDGGIETIKEVVFPGLNRSIKTLDYYPISGNNYYKSVVDIYNPSNFKLGTPGSYKGSEMNEVWFEGPAIFINTVEVQDFVDEI